MREFVPLKRAGNVVEWEVRKKARARHKPWDECKTVEKRHHSAAALAT